MNHFFSDKSKRTLSLHLKHADSQAFGCNHQPLILIEPEQIVLDKLHLLLRLGDVLLSNLVDDCKQADSKLEVLGKKPHHTEDLVKAIRECGVVFSMWTEKCSTELKWSSLTGSEYNKLFRFLPEKLLFVIQNDTHNDISFLWRELCAIHGHITKNKIDSSELF